MLNLRPIAIVGAGGVGREVAWLIERINAERQVWDFIGFYDDHATETIERHPVLGTIADLIGPPEKPLVVCAMGDPRIRYQVVARLDAAGCSYATLVDPSVLMSNHVLIGEGSIICASTVFTTNIRVGRHSILSPNCTVGHDTILGDFSSLMPATNIAGEVKVGTGCYFGLNSCVINRKQIGDWTIVGAGAVVTSDLPGHVVAVGVPAKPVKTIE